MTATHAPQDTDRRGLARPQRAVRRAIVGGAAGLAVTGAGYVAMVDPRSPSTVLPKCPFKLLTGLDCPGCGGLRMTHDLLTGQLSAALADNAVLLLLAPLLLCLVVVAALQWVRGRTVRVPPALTIALGVIGVAWAIARNLT